MRVPRTAVSVFGIMEPTKERQRVDEHSDDHCQPFIDEVPSPARSTCQKHAFEQQGQFLSKRRRRVDSDATQHLHLFPKHEGTLVTLEPFTHQVTGRSHMLSLTGSMTLCKSLLPRELLFYTSMPEDMIPNTPELKGVLYARLENPTDKNGHRFTTTELFLKSDVAKMEKAPIIWKTSAEDDVHQCTTLHDTERKKCYKKVLFKGLERVNYEVISGFSSNPWTIDKDADAVTESVGVNPWSFRQHRREINLLSRDSTLNGRLPKQEKDTSEAEVENNTKDDVPGQALRGYLLLQDVTAGFRHPNVMDLKIGNQIERDDCTQAKKEKHLQLARNSTTGTLLLRLAGMQVYQVNTGHYLCRDKYYGRGLSCTGFKQNMTQFLHNGQRTVVEVIPSMIERLKQLYNALSKLDTFRFYASSLLLIYEGDDACQHNHVDRDDRHVSPDEGEEAPPKVTVRMIDFAHSTYKGFNGDQTCHVGPDQDCLQAILNLISILEGVKAIAQRKDN